MKYITIICTTKTTLTPILSLTYQNQPIVFNISFISCTFTAPSIKEIAIYNWCKTIYICVYIYIKQSKSHMKHDLRDDAYMRKTECNLPDVAILRFDTRVPAENIGESSTWYELTETFLCFTSVFVDGGLADSRALVLPDTAW